MWYYLGNPHFLLSTNRWADVETLMFKNNEGQAMYIWRTHEKQPIHSNGEDEW